MANFIDARRLSFEPFPHPLHPDDVGDSGELELATAKADPSERYIIKRGHTYPEVASNEFLYHKVAVALGLYTQDVKLIEGSKDYRRSAAIRYVPNARLFSLKESSPENFRAYFEFEALFVILNERDSHEYYLDESGRMFKLDNAASFTVEQITLLYFDGDPMGRFFLPDIRVPLNAVDYYMYGGMYERFMEAYGQVAADAYLSVMQRFSEFDESVLDDAYAALAKQYPKPLIDYYTEFIRIRKKACQTFIDEVAADR